MLLLLLLLLLFYIWVAQPPVLIEDFPVLRSVVMAPIPKDEMNVWLTAVTGAQIVDGFPAFSGVTGLVRMSSSKLFVIIQKYYDTEVGQLGILNDGLFSKF